MSLSTLLLEYSSPGHRETRTTPMNARYPSHDIARTKPAEVPTIGTKRTSEIDQQMERMSKNLQILLVKVQQLSDRLMPVRRNEPPAPCEQPGKAEVDLRSPLAGWMEGRNNEVMDIGQVIDRINETLDIN